MLKQYQYRFIGTEDIALSDQSLPSSEMVGCGSSKSESSESSLITPLSVRIKERDLAEGSAGNLLYLGDVIRLINVLRRRSGGRANVGLLDCAPGPVEVEIRKAVRFEVSLKLKTQVPSGGWPFVTAYRER